MHTEAFFSLSLNISFFVQQTLSYSDFKLVHSSLHMKDYLKIPEKENLRKNQRLVQYPI